MVVGRVAGVDAVGAVDQSVFVFFWALALNFLFYGGGVSVSVATYSRSEKLQ